MDNTLKDWYKIDNEDEVFSPALLVYPERIEENIRRMITIAGDASRLRPHVKTHKMSEIIRLQMKHRINKFKCATIAEAEMAAGCGAHDILLAYQPVGPGIARFFTLQSAFPETHFSCITDSGEIMSELADQASSLGQICHLWLDLNVGMDRTGIKPGEEAMQLAKKAFETPSLKLEGLHVYDGHLHDADPVLRKRLCDEGFSAVMKFISDLDRSGIKNLKIVAGGSPTFPVHALRSNVELSPGTLLLWDYGYASAFSDMDFLQAAVLFARVVSKPASDLICLDLGHKAVASEMPQPRIFIPYLSEYSIISHNEEHMVLRTPEAAGMKPGTSVYAIPYHICPTVDRYDTVSVVMNGRVTGQWIVEARRRKIKI